jgi:hypothetical protein
LLTLPFHTYWSGRADLNRRPPAPKAGALTRLRYVPNLKPLKDGDVVSQGLVQCKSKTRRVLSVVRCPLLYEQKAQGIVASEKGPRRERQERINPGVRRKVTDFLTTENTKRSLLNRRQTQTTASAVSIVRCPLC